MIILILSTKEKKGDGRETEIGTLRREQRKRRTRRRTRIATIATTATKVRN